MSEYNQSEHEREPESTQQNPSTSVTDDVVGEIKAKLLFFVVAIAVIIMIKIFWL